jgi:hypothetical protein
MSKWRSVGGVWKRKGAGRAKFNLAKPKSSLNRQTRFRPDGTLHELTPAPPAAKGKSS